MIDGFKDSQKCGESSIIGKDDSLTTTAHDPRQALALFMLQRSLRSLFYREECIVRVVELWLIVTNLLQHGAKSI